MVISLCVTDNWLSCVTRILEQAGSPTSSAVPFHVTGCVCIFFYDYSSHTYPAANVTSSAWLLLYYLLVSFNSRSAESFTEEAPSMQSMAAGH